jgi:hypothetical protein
VSGSRSAFKATARTLPFAVRGSVRIAAALIGAVTWLSARGLPPVYRLGSEVLRRPLDWVFRILLASLGFWRQAALDLALVRWLLLGLAALFWLAWGYGYTRLVLGGIVFELALGAVLGLTLEHRARKVRREEGPDAE